jgi:hypothetical protein
MKTSFNGNLVLKPWKGSKELEAKQLNRGLVGVENKIGVTGLELLVDFQYVLGQNSHTIDAGSVIYFKDNELHVQKWSKEVYYSEDFSEGFVIGNFQTAVFVDKK